MKQILKIQQTKITDKLNCVSASSYNLTINPNMFVGMITVCDMDSIKNNNKKTEIKRYTRLDLETIEKICMKFDFEEILLFNDFDKDFDYSLLHKKTKSYKLIEHCLHNIKWDENHNGIMLPNMIVSQMLYNDVEMDYFQKRSFDVLKIQTINKILKVFGMKMSRFNISTQIVEKITN